MIDTMKRTLIKALTLGAVSGCAGAEPSGRSVSIAKFNYTDRYIGDVIVDGAWTGGVDAFGGGSKLAQGLLAPSGSDRVAVLKVKWVVADLYDVAANKYSRRPDESHEASVEVARPYPTNPSYLILHFYPDGRVEAELEADRPKRRIPPPAGYHR
jgi:hypothetical protein